ncbi:hypothetical protein EF847_04215 [Actinobacteria bacterium YIM 96077]|nr:hypothetical protein EF847_04215 [Actinobacteria bacterium YIM 96077]
MGSATASDDASSADSPVADVRMHEYDTADFEEQADDLPPGLVEAIERDLDVSPERYLAQAAAAKNAADVVNELGDIVTAAWLDGSTLHVVVEDRADEPAAAATGAEVHVGDSLTDAVDAARQQGRLAIADRETDSVRPLEAEFTGGPYEEEHDPDQNGAQPEGDVHGGFGYGIVEGDSVFRCTAAFNGTGPDGNPRTLTSGQCSQGESGLLDGVVGLLDGLLSSGASEQDSDKDGDGHEDGGDGHEDTADPPNLDEQRDDVHRHDPDDHGDGETGPFARFVEDSIGIGDGHDVAQLAVSTTAWTPTPSVATEVGEGEQGPQVPIYDSTLPISGAPVCSSGAVSDWTCGSVLGTEMSVPVGDEEVSGFMLDACSLPGDMGGPVVSGNYAIGITSGSTQAGSECDEADDRDATGQPVTLAYALAGGPDTVRERYGDEWNLAVHVGTPDVTAPVEGDVTGKEPTVRGRVDAAAGATVVVDVDGAEPVEAEVQADGTWRAPIEESLSPGRHTYTVAASHAPSLAGDATTSEAVTETFEVAEVASLVVQSPADGETTSNVRPSFTGTGDPGARITLEFDDEMTSTVVDADGTWSIAPPEGPRAGRFDAMITQETGGGTANTSIEGVGIVPGAPVVVGPGGEVTARDVISGTGIPGSTVAARIQPSSEEREGSPEPATDAESERERIATTDEEGNWEVELEGLPPGRYTVSAIQAVDDLKSERSASVTFEIVGPPTGERRGVDADEDDLAETGTSLLLPILGGLLLFGLGSVGLWWRRRAVRGA